MKRFFAKSIINALDSLFLFANFYSQKVLPFLGGLVSGKPEAYHYLNDSSQVFPCGEAFKNEVMATGAYESVEVTSLSFGIAYIYKCKVL